MKMGEVEEAGFEKGWGGRGDVPSLLRTRPRWRVLRCDNLNQPQICSQKLATGSAQPAVS